MRALGPSLAAASALVAVPIALAALAARPVWRVGVRERLGDSMRIPPGAIWVHAASVGEVLAASRLVTRLRLLDRNVYTSTFTVNGREVMWRTRPEVPCQLAPLDHPWCVERALDRVQPAALVLVETELWPSWIAAAERREIPVVLVSARLSDRSYSRYRRFGWIVSRTLRRLAAVGARTPEDAERFRALGAHPDRVSVTGDLKIDLDDERRPMAPDLDGAVGHRSLFVAGSTHEGEETAALDALRYVESKGLDVSLVLAPRHPKRTPEVARLVRAAGRKPRLRSALSDVPLRSGEVLVLDTVGELASLYARADVAFVGGSLVPIGGHNVIEPVFAGRPVVYGRYTANVRHVVEILGECGAGTMVHDAAELGPAVAALLIESDRAFSAAKRGRVALMRHIGSGERTGALIEKVIMAAAIGAS